MLSKQIFLKAFLVLLGLTSNIPVGFVGVLKLAELLALFYVLLNRSSLFEITAVHKDFRKYSLFLMLWLCLGSVASLINMTDYPYLYSYIPPPVAFAKGAANIFFIWISTSVFVIALAKDPSLVVYYLVPYGLSSAVFSPYQYTMEDSTQKNFLMLTSSDVSDNYFDMYVSPILTPIAISLPFLLKGRTSIAIVLIAAFGLLAVAYDAKSMGFIFIMASAALTLNFLKVKLSPTMLKFLFVLSPVVVIPVLVMLAQANLLGSSGDKIIRDINRTEHFNPLLLIGRPAPTIAMVAIWDEPLLGHGFNKQDLQYPSRLKALGYLPFEYSERYRGIPAHSNLLNAMVEGGIAAGLVWIFLLVISFKSFYIAFTKDYEAITGYLFISFFYLLWNILFSGTLRLDIGHFIAIIIGYNHRNSLQQGTLLQSTWRRQLGKPVSPV